MQDNNDIHYHIFENGYPRQIPERVISKKNERSNLFPNRNGMYMYKERVVCTTGGIPVTPKDIPSTDAAFVLVDPREKFLPCCYQDVYSKHIYCPRKHAEVRRRSLNCSDPNTRNIGRESFTQQAQLQEQSLCAERTDPKLNEAQNPNPSRQQCSSEYYLLLKVTNDKYKEEISQIVPQNPKTSCCTIDPKLIQDSIILARDRIISAKETNNLHCEGELGRVFLPNSPSHYPLNVGMPNFGRKTVPNISAQNQQNRCRTRLQSSRITL